MPSVFIDGAAGTTGLEIGERLSGRPELDLITLDDADRKDARARAAALNAADFVILCLPDDAAREAVALIENTRTRVIDASTAHRVAAGWTYGFAELNPGQTNAIAASARVTNPGCYPTGFLAIVAPLVRNGLVPASWPFSVNAVSGYSGGGKAMIGTFEGGDEATAFRAYALDLGHKHVPEMQHHVGLDHPPIFTPAVARAYRGMIVEVPLPLNALPGRPELAAVAETLMAAYRDSRLVRVTTGGEELLRLEDDPGTDRMTIHIRGNAKHGQARLIATLDNLGKGAAGAAVQNLNIMAGLDPYAGLIL